MPAPLQPNNIFQRPTFMKGMNYAGFQTNVFSSPESDQAIADLAGIQANWVAVNVFWYQKDKHDTQIHANAQKTASDASVMHLIRQIRSNGMKVMLKPMVDSLDETWRGQFEPRNLESWFSSYESFILHYARMAQELGVELFCIGCEYPLHFDFATQHWQEIIKKVREDYAGPLTYAANFNKSNSYRKVKFWDLLEFIGIDAYFPVARKKASSVKRMQRGWKKCRRRIEKWRRRKGIDKPVIFTELGVSSVTGGAIKLWAYDSKLKSEWKEQANYYESFFHTFQNREWFSGAFWWWWDNPSTGDFIHDQNSKYKVSYSPKGKDAQAILEAYYA